jgi:hypothetical protein
MSESNIYIQMPHGKQIASWLVLMMCVILFKGLAELACLS